MFKAAPLKSSFMLAAILGLIITTIYTYSGRISTDWGIALGVVFACMFIASIISMRKAPIDSQLEYGRGFVHPGNETPWEKKTAAKPAKRKTKISVPRPKPKSKAKVRTKKARAKPKKAKKKAVKKKAKKPAKKAKKKAKPKKKAAKKK